MEMKLKKPKTGGRTLGTPNKSSAKIKEYITSLIGEHLELVSRDILVLEPKERIDVLIKLLPYAIPKLQSVEYEDKGETKGSPLLKHIESLK